MYRMAGAGRVVFNMWPAFRRKTISRTSKLKIIAKLETKDRRVGSFNKSASPHIHPHCTTCSPVASPRIHPVASRAKWKLKLNHYQHLPLIKHWLGATTFFLPLLPLLSRPAWCFFPRTFLSQATRPISHRVGRSVRRSVRPSHFTFSAFLSCLKVE